MARGARGGRVVALTLIGLGVLTAVERSSATAPVESVATAAAIEDSPLLLPPPVRLVRSTAETTTPAPAVASKPKRPAKPSAVPTSPRVRRPTRTRPRPAPAPAPGIAGIGTIEIPKIGLIHELYNGSTLATIDLGPSRMVETAMPGEPGNTAIGGHRVTHTHPFRNIHLLAVGDHIIFHVNGKRSVYAMTEAFVVTPDRIDILDPTPTPTATLFACHPPGSAKYRYVVRAALVG